MVDEICRVFFNPKMRRNLYVAVILVVLLKMLTSKARRRDRFRSLASVRAQGREMTQVRAIPQSESPS